jgi:hypothetical protein
MGCRKRGAPLAVIARRQDVEEHAAVGQAGDLVHVPVAHERKADVSGMIANGNRSYVAVNLRDHGSTRRWFHTIGISVRPCGRNGVMTEPTDLQRARDAAQGVEHAARQLVEFTNRLNDEIGPADMVEYDTLIGREAAALSERVDAFAALGLAVASIDDEAGE